MSFADAALFVAWVAILILAFAMAGMIRQLAVLRHAVAPRGAGTHHAVGPRIGDFVQPLRGEPDALGKARLVLFADRMCPSCERLLPAFSLMASRHRDVQFVLALLDGEGVSAEDAEPLIVLMNQAQVSRDLLIPATPYLVAISPSATVTAAGLAASEQDLSKFVAAASES